MRHRYLFSLLLLLPGSPVAAQTSPYGSFAALASDRVARQVGDLLTVVIYQASETRNVARASSSRRSDVGGSIGAGSLSERGDLSVGGSFTGGGQFERSERFVTQLTVTVVGLLGNGDLLVQGEQQMRINGEDSRVGVRGRVRLADIDARNQVLSSRIADARISYDGRGFVASSAKPGLVSRIFRFLGLS